MDKKLEKKQVLVFLKILKISKRLPPAEIATKLISTGWDEADAYNAASVLYPDYAPVASTTSSSTLADLPSTEIPQPTQADVTPSTQTEAVLDIPPPMSDITEVPLPMSDITEVPLPMSDITEVPPPMSDITEVPLPTSPLPAEAGPQSYEVELDTEVTESTSYEEEFIPQDILEAEDEYEDVSEVTHPESFVPAPFTEATTASEASWPEYTTAHEITPENEVNPETEIPAQEHVSLSDDKVEEESLVRDAEMVDELVPGTVSNVSSDSSYIIPEPEQSDVDDSVLTTSSPEDDRWKKDQVKVSVTPATPPVVRSMSDTTVTVPHQDAPWLKDQTDIYDITEEEKELLIKTVLNSHDKLNPKTVHALLGIDVSLSEYESVYRRKRRRGLPEWLQATIIIVVSIALAAGLLYYGLKHFEVGPFHPSVVQSR